MSTLDDTPMLSALKSLAYRLPTFSRWSLIYGRPSHEGDAMALWGRSLPFDTRFRSAYDQTLEFTSDRLRRINIQWRAYTCCWAAESAMKVPGDFVECGVNTGILSGTICRYLDFARVDRKFWLFDTYEGIPIELAKGDERRKVDLHNRHYADVYEVAKANFAKFPNARLVKGRVPDSLGDVVIDRVAYLSMDMNVVEPERAALTYFWPKISPGGVIVLDDYGFVGHEDQRAAADRFAVGVASTILSLPTGQGLLFKPL